MIIEWLQRLIASTPSPYLVSSKSIICVHNTKDAYRNRNLVTDKVRGVISLVLFLNSLRLLPLKYRILSLTPLSLICDYTIYFDSVWAWSCLFSFLFFSFKKKILYWKRYYCWLYECVPFILIYLFCFRHAL